MTIGRVPTFRDLSDAIRELPQPLVTPELLPNELRLYKDEHVSIYYAPFDYVDLNAKIVIVGVTPGWSQTCIAYRVAKEGLAAGRDPDRVLADVKRAASFAGTMRSNLIAMLDELGLPKTLGVASTGSLVDDRNDVLHTTSALRNPVFVNGQNYTGHEPPLLKTPVLAALVEEQLGPELASIDSALVVPLGKAVEGCLDLLVRRRVLPEYRILFGFPHPSGANGHRDRQFRTSHPELERTLQDWASRTR